MIACPLCGASATIRQYAYCDYETGYRDAGMWLNCSECGERDESEVERILNQREQVSK